METQAREMVERIEDKPKKKFRVRTSAETTYRIYRRIWQIRRERPEIAFSYWEIAQQLNDEGIRWDNGVTIDKQHVNSGIHNMEDGGPCKGGSATWKDRTDAWEKEWAAKQAKPMQIKPNPEKQQDEFFQPPTREEPFTMKTGNSSDAPKLELIWVLTILYASDFPMGEYTEHEYFRNAIDADKRRRELEEHLQAEYVKKISLERRRLK